MTIQTVTCPIAVDEVRLADAHAHVWIEPPEGVASEAALRLHDAEAIRAELNDFYSAGGTTLIDCQPGGCGRDGNRLAELARATGVHITASTGFHQQKYYPPEYWLWSASAEEAATYFVEELTVVCVKQAIRSGPRRSRWAMRGYFRADAHLDGSCRRSVTPDRRFAPIPHRTRERG